MRILRHNPDGHTLRVLPTVQRRPVVFHVFVTVAGVEPNGDHFTYHDECVAGSVGAAKRALKRMQDESHAQVVAKRVTPHLRDHLIAPTPLEV